MSVPQVFSRRLIDFKHAIESCDLQRKQALRCNASVTIFFNFQEDLKLRRMCSGYAVYRCASFR